MGAAKLGPNSAAGHSHTAWPRFTIAALLWVMVSLSMTLAYGSAVDSNAVPELLLVLVGSVLIGSFVGLICRRPGDTLCWALLGGALIFVPVAGQSFVNRAVAVGWPLVGVIGGSLAASAAHRHVLHSVWLGATGGLVYMLILVGMTFGYGSEGLLDVACAGLAGALLGLVVHLVQWIERRSGPPRYVTAAGLLLAMIGGNTVARLLDFKPWMLE